MCVFYFTIKEARLDNIDPTNAKINSTNAKINSNTSRMRKSVYTLSCTYSKRYQPELEA